MILGSTSDEYKRTHSLERSIFLDNWDGLAYKIRRHGRSKWEIAGGAK
jgi:hypothetical protein